MQNVGVSVYFANTITKGINSIDQYRFTSKHIKHCRQCISILNAKTKIRNYEALIQGCNDYLCNIFSQQKNYTAVKFRYDFPCYLFSVLTIPWSPIPKVAISFCPMVINV